MRRVRRSQAAMARRGRAPTILLTARPLDRSALLTDPHANVSVKVQVILKKRVEDVPEMTEPVETEPERLPAFAGGAPDLAALPAAWADRLESLRRMLTRSRLCPHCSDWCALDRRVWGGDRLDAEALGRMFMTLLGRHAARPMAFYRTGTGAVSADEMWLLRLVDSVRAGDEPSLRALIGFRVRPDARWRMRLLATAFADALLGRADARRAPLTDPKGASTDERHTGS